jgi:oligosaccharide repeat unit polymerase
MSTTPTLQGAFYIDFGIAGVFFGFFFIAIIYNLLIKKIKYNYNPILVFVSLYIFTNLIISIHVGYWDIIVLIFIFITFLILSFLLLFGIKIIKLRY